ncbi:Vgb family protein [Herbiconiux sp. YIM B11900]|uniref:Vgb family protein n=1 Tax=Herbiconiux sp. YIM B11900 TaxID=3404131 RepID=UPI003F85DD52
MSSSVPVSRRHFLGAAAALAVAGSGAAASLRPEAARALDVRPGGFVTWHEFALPSAAGMPGAILCDALDRVWYTDDANKQLIMFPAASPAAYTTVDLGPAGPSIGTLLAAPDGAIWFNDFAEPQMGRFDPLTTAVSMFPTGGSGTAFSPVVGSDGAIWFGDPGNEGIASLASDGTITRVRDPHGSLVVHVVAAGDGRLWYSRDGLPVLVRYDPATGVFDELLLSGGDTYGLTVDTVGEVWVGTHGLVSHVAAGDVVTEYPIPSTIPFWPGYPTSLAAGHHARLYFTDEQLGLGRIDPGGAVTFQRPPFAGAAPRELAVTSVGTLWYTDPARGTIGCF